jgi:antitoxin component YwqK of YwqJK toxin-antitoxin module
MYILKCLLVILLFIYYLLLFKQKVAGKVTGMFLELGVDEVFNIINQNTTNKLIGYIEEGLYLMRKKEREDQLKKIEILLRFGFEEIVISKSFQIDNGVLGLERDMYLSIVKFLNSSILRKV